MFYATNQYADHVVDMRPTGPDPWARLSPHYQHGKIPVPGLPSMHADSIMGVFEALKLIGKPGVPGKMNLGYLVGPGRYRKVPSGRFLQGYRGYDGRAIGVVQARTQLQLAAFRWVMHERLAGVVRKLESLDEPVFLYDGSPGATSGVTCNPHDARPLCLSGAVMVAAWMNGQVDDVLAGYQEPPIWFDAEESDA